MEAIVALEKRGALEFKDIKLGDVFVYEWGPVTRELIRNYAFATKTDFKIHTSDIVAKLMGLKGIIAHGLMSSGIVVSFLERNFPECSLLDIKTEMRTIIRPGDSSRIELKVIRPHKDSLTIGIRQYTITPMYIEKEGKKTKEFEGGIRKYVSKRDWEKGLVKSERKGEGTYRYREVVSIIGYAELVPDKEIPGEKNQVEDL